MKYHSVFMSCVVFIFVSYIVVCAVAHNGEWNKIHISKSGLPNPKHFNENTDYYHIYNWYEVRPDKVLTITIDLPSSYFRCWYYLNRTPINSGFQCNYNDCSLGGTITTVHNVTISGIWQCKIRPPRGQNSKTIMLLIKIRVIDFNPPQTVFVNRIAVPTHREYLRDHTGFYYYEAGDTLDVACFLPDDNCKILPNFKSALKTENEVWGLSSQYNFEAKDNNMIVTCTTKCGDHVTDLKVTFKQHSNTNHYVNVKINGQVIKIQSNVINYSYFFNDDFLTITANSNYKNVRITYGSEFCILSDQRDDTNSVSFKIKPEEISKITLYARDETRNEVKEQVIIVFTPIDTNDNSHLAINLPRHNVKQSLKVYEFGGSIFKTYYIYNYYDEESLLITCSQTVPVLDSRLKINGIEQNKHNEKTSYSKHKYFQNADNNTEWSCTLEQTKPYLKIIAEIDILFLLKPLTTTSTINPMENLTPSTTLAADLPNTTPTTVSSRTSTTTSPEPTKSPTTNDVGDDDDDDDDMKWIIIGVGIVAFFGLICVCIVIYKMKIRDCLKNQTDENYDSLENDNNTEIPPYPAQWESDYAVTEDEMYNNSLYCTQEPIYTKPIPKNLREGKKKLAKIKHVPGATYKNSKEVMPYASLDLKTQKPGSSQSIYANEGSSAVNSPIIPQNPKYENIAGSDYVEPVYCEPTVMK